MVHLQIQLPDGSSQTHELTDERTTIGRIEDNLLVILHDSVSSHHAEIVQDGDKFVLRDLGSTNGTFVDTQPVTEAPLQDGAQIRFGAVAVTFVSAEAGSGSSQPPPKSSAPATEVAHLSSRPANFTCSSPLPRNVQKKDPMALVALLVGGIGLLTALAAAVMALTVSA